MNRWSAVDISYMSELENIGRCAFLTQGKGPSSMLQHIPLKSFSVLINNGFASFNLSIFAGCYGNRTNNVTIGVSMLKENHLYRNHTFSTGSCCSSMNFV
jgi:hypothetical protein